MKRIILLSFFVCFGVVAEPVTEVGELSSLMKTWLDLESQKSHLQTEWLERKVELKRRAQLYEAEKKALQELLDQAGESSSDLDEQRQRLTKDQQKLEQEQALLSAQLEQTSIRASQLKPRLPPPLQLQWSEKLPLLSDRSSTTSQKLELLLGLFKLAEEFNDRVALNNVAMTFTKNDGGLESVMVTQMYLGLAQGWYLSEDGSRYGFGRPTEQGWKWWDGEDASKELGLRLNKETLAEFRSILSDPTKAKFLQLPIKL